MEKTHANTMEAGSGEPVPLSRRGLIGLLGAAAGLSAGCDGDTTPTPTTPATPSAPATPTTSTPTGSQCAITPEETGGPFPSIGDFVRSDVRGGSEGTELRLEITVVDASDNCAPVSGAAVSIWQCDAAGDYSQYGSARSETFLRGVQTTDAEGKVEFTTVYPGWYQGRATHIHVEVSLEGRTLKTSQIAFPDEVSAAVHATGVYAPHGRNPTTNASDGIFRDGVSLQLASLSGDPGAGYRGTFQLGVAL